MLALTSLVLLSSVAALAAPASAAAAAPALPSAVGAPPPPTPVTTAARAILPADVAAGPDGNLWFTSHPAGSGDSGHIGRATPSGSITTFDETPIEAGAIVAGPDGNMWFTDGPAIGRISMTGVVTVFPLPAGSEDTTDLTAGPDGNLWFTSYYRGLVGKITTDGTITIVFENGDGGGNLPSLNGGPGEITSGPDGNLWFTLDAPPMTGGSIVRMTTAGQATTFGITFHPGSITGGPDGNVWFTIQDRPGVNRITPDGTITELTDPALGQGSFIVAGPDGNLWVAPAGPSGLTRLTTAGVATAVPVPVGVQPQRLAVGPGTSIAFTASSAVGSISTTTGVTTMVPGPHIVGPDHITAGPDGNLWFTNNNLLQYTYGDLPDSISRITPNGVVTAFTDPLIDYPREIVVGPDGALWATVSTGIVRVTTSGAVSLVVANLGGPMAMGPDGNLWVGGTNTFQRVTATGAVTTFADPAIGTVVAVTSGPDGALWYLTNDSVRRMTLQGVVSLFPLQGGLSWVGSEITTGADGNLWLTMSGGVGRMTPTGQLTFFTDGLIDQPSGIAAGPDGDIWFTNASTGVDLGSIVQVAGDGTITHHLGNDLRFVRDLALGADGGMWVTNPVSSSILHVDVAAPSGTPGPPTVVTATAVDGGAVVAWSAPTWAGTSPITGYTATAEPGGATCTWSAGSRSCSIAGLTNGATYTFRVAATNSSGTGPPSAPSAPTRIVTGTGLFFHPMAPVRVLDSRGTTGGWSGPLQAGSPRSLDVAGGSAPGSVPATAGAVVLNVTATESTANSFLTISPAGAPSATSSLNFAPGQTIPNLVTVAVGTGGWITMATASGSVHVVADLVGYYDAGADARFATVTPQRILDSRGPVGSWNADLVAGAPRPLAVRGQAGVSMTAEAIVVNVTATNSTANSFLTVYPAGGSTPLASNLNFGAGETIANLVTVPVGADGQIAFATAAGAVDVVADVVGFYDPAAGDRYHPISPTRLLDSRTGTGGWNAPLGTGTPRPLPVAGTAPIPVEATALVANTTATSGTANSFLTVFPAGTAPPATSNLNFASGQTIPNAMMTRLGSGGAIAYRNAAGTVHVVLDAAGYLAPT